MSTTQQNPFKPIFGKTPPVLIDREAVIDDYITALDSYLSSEKITTLFVGQRGMGKTVILNEISSRATRKNWIGIDVSMSESLLQNIYDRLRIEAKDYLAKHSTKLTGVTLNVLGFGAGISTSSVPDDYSTITKISLIVEELSKKDIGTLFVIDEAKSSSAALREFASNYQLMLRKDLKVGCVVAGLPFEISGLINDGVLTFLRRANRVTLSNVDINDVAVAYTKVFSDYGRDMPLDIAVLAAQKTNGYPYMIQLLGSILWDAYKGSAITKEEVLAAAIIAKNKVYANVIEPLANDLTSKELELVKAMAKLKQPTKVLDIATALELKSTDISQYRKRLIEKYFLFSPSRGLLDFVLPYTKEYLLSLKNEY